MQRVKWIENGGESPFRSRKRERLNIKICQYVWSTRSRRRVCAISFFVCLCERMCHFHPSIFNFCTVNCNYAKQGILMTTLKEPTKKSREKKAIEANGTYTRCQTCQMGATLAKSDIPAFAATTLYRRNEYHNMHIWTDMRARVTVKTAYCRRHQVSANFICSSFSSVGDEIVCQGVCERERKNEERSSHSSSTF